MKLIYLLAFLCFTSATFASTADKITCYNGGVVTYKGCGYRIDKEDNALIFTECKTGNFIYIIDPKCVMKFSKKHYAKKT